ncbi:MAG TPA: PEP-CTERM sorting domain-containing protein, partial [Pirellulales bacterium]
NTALNNVLQLGDLNFDHKITVADVQAMMAALSNMSGFETTNSLSNAGLLDVADVNRDGVVNNQDVQALVSYLASSPASLLADLTTASDHLPVVADYIIPVGSGSIAAVPEPSSMILMVIGFAGLALRRKRVVSR